MTKPIYAWHFVGDKLRDGRPVPKDGEKLIHDGEIKLCSTGLHASRRIIDALRYAPANIICRVRCGGDVKEETDKLVCSERTILWRIDSEEVLRRFARQCALDVSHLWNMPKVVDRWLITGDEQYRAAAWDAAWYAAGAAARDAARDAAWAAAGAAAKDAAGAAAKDAAWAAAKDAAWAAARDAQNKTLTRMVLEAHRTGDWR